MGDFYLNTMSDYQTKFDNNDASILNYIDTNPGSTEAEIATGLSKNAALVHLVVRVLEEVSLVVAGYDQSGTKQLWTAEDWAGLLKSNLGDARTWIAANTGDLMSDMATDLSLPFAVCQGLAHIMEREGTGRTTATT